MLEANRYWKMDVALWVFEESTNVAMKSFINLLFNLIINLKK